MANIFELVGNVAVDNDKAIRDLKETERQAKETSSSMGQKFKKAGAALGRAIQKGAVVAGAALTGLGVKSTKTLMDFEGGMREVFTLIPDASEEMKQELESDIQDLGEQYGFMTDDTVPALYQAISAGVPPENAITFLETAARSAKAGATDLQTAVDGLTSAVNAYGREALSADEASDIMFNTVKEGKTTYPELANNMSNVTPIASSLGVTFRDVNAAIATMTKQGMATGKSTIYMRSMLNQLSKEGTDANKVFQETAGVGFTKFIEKGNSLGDALRLMQGYAENNNTSIKKLFGNVRAGTAAMMLTGDQAGEFNRILGTMEDTAGSTDEAYQEMTKSLRHQWERLKAWWEGTELAIGSALEDDIRALMDWLEQNKGQIRNTLVAIFEGVTTAIRSVVNFVPKARKAVKNFVDRVVEFKNSIPDSVWKTLKQVGKSIGAIAGALAVTVGGMALWSAITALGGALATIVTGPAAVIAGITAALTAGQKVWNAFFGDLTPIIKEFASVLGSSGLKAIKDTVSALMSGEIDQIPGIWKDAFQKVKKAAISVWPDIKREAAEGMSEMWTAIKGKLKGLGKKFANKFPDLAKVIKDKAPGISKAFNELVSAGKGLAHQVKTKIVQPVAKVLGNLFGDLSGGKEGSPINRLEVFKDMVKNQLDSVLSIVEGIIEQITNIFELGEAVLSGDWKKALKKLKDIVTKQLELAKEAVSMVIENIIGILKLTGIWDEIKSTWKTIETVLDNNLIKPIKNAPSTVSTYIQDIIDKITDPFENLGQNFKNLGKNVVDGIWKGIKNQGVWFKKKWNKWVENNIPGVFEGMLKIGSPSRVMRRKARAIPQGIALGITDGKGRVIHSIEELNEAIEEGQDDIEDSSKTGADILKEYEEALKEAKERAKELGDESFTTKDKIDLLRTYIQKMIDNGVDPASEAFQKLLDKLDEVQTESEDAGDSTQGVWEGVAEGLGEQADSILATWVDAFDAMVNEGQSAAKALQSAFKQTGSIIGRVIGSQFGMPQVGGAIGGLIGGWIGNLFGPSEREKRIRDMKEDLQESMKSALEGAFSADTWSGFLERFGNSLEQMVKSKLIKAFITTGAMKERIDNLTRYMAEALVDAQLSQDERQKIREKYQAITSRLKPIFETIKGLTLTPGQEDTETKAQTLPSAVRSGLSELRGVFSQVTRPGSAGGEEITSQERSSLRDILSDIQGDTDVTIQMEDIKLRSEQDIENLAQRLKSLLENDNLDRGEVVA